MSLSTQLRLYVHRFGIGIAAGGCARDEDRLLGDVGRVGARVGRQSAASARLQAASARSFASFSSSASCACFACSLALCGVVDHTSHKSSQRLWLRQL